MRFVIAMLAAGAAGMAPVNAQALIPIPASVTSCPGSLDFEQLKPNVDPSFQGVESYLAKRLPIGESETKIVVHPGSFPNAEAYTLEVTPPSGVTIFAANRTGAIHAIATLAQLNRNGKLPCIRISDQPRFPWRGLLLDVSRHFIPIEALLHTLDRMAAVKLNVLHLHLADDQGVRVESIRYPLLQQRASGGQYYTQEQLRTLIRYAQDLGIRIVPEFDFPGHATAWFAAYPEYASAPGPYSIERKIGIFDPAFDPSNPQTYAFITGFLGEMAGLFPDDYIHLGGDEVTGKHWDANPRIQAFKKTENIASNHELQVYFEDRMHEIVTTLGKKLVLWDEAIHPKAAADITFQAWRGPNALLASTFLKHPTLVSYGFYLDWGLSTEQLYHNNLNGVLPDETDPILKRLNPMIPIPSSRPLGMMTELEAASRLGGEAALWTEFTTPGNIENRLWPRAAVVAERLWSAPDKSKDVDDLLRRLAADFPQPQAKPLEELLEPGKYVYRHLSHKYTVDSPMNQLVDRLPPESLVAQQFNRAALKHQYQEVRDMLMKWSTTQPSPDLDPALVADIRKALTIGLEALNASSAAKPRPPNWTAASFATLKALSDNHREIVIAICPGLINLVATARTQ